MIESNNDQDEATKAIIQQMPGAKCTTYLKSRINMTTSFITTRPRVIALYLVRFVQVGPTAPQLQNAHPLYSVHFVQVAVMLCASETKTLDADISTIAAIMQHQSTSDCYTHHFATSDNNRVRYSPSPPVFFSKAGDCDLDDTPCPLQSLEDSARRPPGLTTTPHTLRGGGVARCKRETGRRWHWRAGEHEGGWKVL